MDKQIEEYLVFNTILNGIEQKKIEEKHILL